MLQTKVGVEVFSLQLKTSEEVDLHTEEDKYMYMYM